MSDETFSGLAAWLALNRLGRRFFALARNEFGEPCTLFRQDDTSLQQRGFSEAFCRKIDDARTPGSPLRCAVAADMAFVQASDVQVVHWQHPDYPPLLREIADPPAVLFVRGDAASLSRRQLALVGSRQATRAGLEDAFRFARELASCGIGITSGLARGIDAASHRGALEAQGVTVAVMATGPDSIYPRAHNTLADAIVAGGGALVTEFPPGVGARAQQFPQRNRIIAGLAMGVLVVEASSPSGTLITARLAMEQGREVFAIPGSIHQPQSRGCHRLIREGAALVETVDDILAELGGFASPVAGVASGPAPGLQDQGLQRLLECIEYRPTPVDIIVARAGGDPAGVLAQLTELELAGHVLPEAGGFSRNPRKVSG